MKRNGYFLKIAFTSLFIICGAVNLFAQDDKKPAVEKGVFWSDAVTNTEIYLLQNGKLTVISGQKVKVLYHTKINSSVPVDKELAQKSSPGAAVKYFQIEHNFSRRTIWMTLEFIVGGKKIPALTRTFYDSIFEVVPTEQFFNPDIKN